MCFSFCYSPSLWQKATRVWLPLFLGILAAVSVIAVIVLAVLFGIERNKTKTLQEPSNKS